MKQPSVTDNDDGEITVSLDGRELRGWSYKDDAERRTKMLCAREYVEGWCDGRDAIRDDVMWVRLGAARLAGEVASANAWRLAAEADGWTFRQTYSHEPVEQAFSAERDGFKIQGLARIGDDHGLPHGQISGWCDRGISLMPMPIIYPGFAAIKALARHCPVCGADEVATHRVAFASRACEKCAPDLREKLERPGWCD
jgi:hypothetical protein